MNTLGPSSTADEICAHLREIAGPENLEGMARYGIVTENALGISNTTLRALARQIKPNHERALELWNTGIREARLLAAFSCEPSKLTLDDARSWAADFNSWEIVDGVCDYFFKSDLYPKLIEEFVVSEHEFIRRAAFVIICAMSVHGKKLPDEAVLAYLPLIEKFSNDPRNFVKKAVNWALRNIGKRSLACHGPALSLARNLSQSEDKTARWIGRDAVRELTSEKVVARLKR